MELFMFMVGIGFLTTLPKARYHHHLVACPMDIAVPMSALHACRYYAVDFVDLCLSRAV